VLGRITALQEFLIVGTPARVALELVQARSLAVTFGARLGDLVGARTFGRAGGAHSNGAEESDANPGQCIHGSRPPRSAGIGLQELDARAASEVRPVYWRPHWTSPKGERLRIHAEFPDGAGIGPAGARRHRRARARLRDDPRTAARSRESCVRRHGRTDDR